MVYINIYNSLDNKKNKGVFTMTRFGFSNLIPVFLSMRYSIVLPSSVDTMIVRCHLAPSPCASADDGNSNPPIKNRKNTSNFVFLVIFSFI